jgi:hypothetical protein
MAKRITRLSESDMNRLVKKVIKEESWDMAPSRKRFEGEQELIEDFRKEIINTLKHAYYEQFSLSDTIDEIKGICEKFGY